jgi:hypothetical protein
MNTFAPIAMLQSTDVMRRSIRGAGPGDPVAPAVPERPRSAATLRRLATRRQSGSDQCSIVAAPRKPARA